MENKKNTVHLIGNAHIDPVWLWRFPEGLAEVKATFQAAIDRIYEYDEFVFTSACAFYYKWVEENCPALFSEIRDAVKVGKWKIVGGMWIQPDCNIPSAESFARHLLYSQKYFESRFGIRVKTGYNVDSFGHAGTLPKLLRQGGIENYVYMRPDNGAEKSYPFGDHAFRWKCGEDEVLSFRIRRRYNENLRDGERLADYDEYAASFPYDFMLFYGVGNHGGGPTVQNIESVLAFRKDTETKNLFAFSDPDAYFDTLRAKSFDLLPTYEGELQNHASGCYAANAAIKAHNRRAENRLTESEKFAAMLSYMLPDVGRYTSAEKNREAWENVMFNQFHDIICGCSERPAYHDAYAFSGAAEAYAIRETNAAVQQISWAVDTSKGRVVRRSKEGSRVVWESDSLGTPIVVFNPLSHPVYVPITVNRSECAAVTDENDKPVPFQIVRSVHTNGSKDKYAVRFLANLPCFGYRTFWVHGERTLSAGDTDPLLSADGLTLRNSLVTLTFDETSGEIRQYTVDGEERIGDRGTRAVLIRDEENDTWSHNRFVFDEIVGAFGSPTFTLVESGDCEVSLRVRQSYGRSTLERTYTIRPYDARVYVHTRLFFDEELRILRFLFDSGLSDAEWIREIPGGAIAAPQNGREMPMQRYMLLKKDRKGIAVLNDSKYSAYAKDGEMGFVAARGCYFADHYGERDDRMEMQDRGEQEFSYVLMPYDGKLSAISRAAEELNAVFPAIPETYHEGPLPQMGWACSSEDNIIVQALKPAEDGNGFILRIAETEGRRTGASVFCLGYSFGIRISAFGIQSYRITKNGVEQCDFLE